MSGGHADAGSMWCVIRVAGIVCNVNRTGNKRTRINDTKRTITSRINLNIWQSLIIGLRRVRRRRCERIHRRRADQEFFRANYWTMIRLGKACTLIREAVRQNEAFERGRLIRVLSILHCP